MDTLRTKLYPHIGNIAIGLAIIGLLALTLLVIYPESRFFFYFMPIRFRGLATFFQSSLISNSPWISLPTILFYIMMFVGGLAYRSNKGNIGLLGFSFSILFFDLLIRAVCRPLYYLNWQILYKNDSSLSAEAPGFFRMHWPLLYILPLLFLTFYLTRWLLSDDKYIIETSDDVQGNEYKSHDLVGSGVRFLHWIIDLLLMLLIVVPLFQFLLNFGKVYTGSFNLFDPSLGRLLMSILFMLIMLFYYIIFEGFLGITPIKFLTGCRILHDTTLETPTIGTILLRSISRLIPFDALSFLGARGWHDTVSNTTLVYVKSHGESRKYHRWWLLALLLISFGPQMFEKIQRRQDQIRKSIFRQDISNRSRVSDIKYLGKDDLIVCEKKSRRYRGLYTVLKVVEARQDSLIVQIYQSKPMRDAKRKNVIEMINSSKQNSELYGIGRSMLMDESTGEKRFKIKKFSDEELDNLEYHLINQPEIGSRSSSYKTKDKGRKRSFIMHYSGGNVEVLDLKTLKGRIRWNDTFAIERVFDESTRSGSVELKASNISKRKVSKSEMKIRFDGREMTYILEGLDGDLKFYRAY